MALELVWVWMLFYLLPIQKIFNTATVPLSDLWILLPFPLLLLFSSHELYKWHKRAKNNTASVPTPES